MSLNIKNAETCRLAAELARLTGETKTGAITAALRDRLRAEKRRRNADTLVRELLAIGERCATRLDPGPSAVEHGDFLYDAHGLPK
ncbi:type II toxin-antitoxin system VapB family antitoxin [Candidatus Palauibacter sp.]|uniref:type II toxin-antitoxin system VapB family antitoxin n=1 Tax=Candidatus Palauibacter sp. TaxID=3101350 RepID=UPI003AF29778